MYKVLIVANKFQTGFDEPRLMAMYVGKKPIGGATVQSLSRLNRTHPGKTAPMVVDFPNTPASVQKDFQHYYSDAHVDGDVDRTRCTPSASAWTPPAVRPGRHESGRRRVPGRCRPARPSPKALAPVKNNWTT